MKTSELRIGNYVNIRGEIKKVGAVGDHTVFTQDWEGIRGFADIDIDPNPLTKKWLLKLGFSQIRPRYGGTRRYRLGAYYADDTKVEHRLEYEYRVEFKESLNAPYTPLRYIQFVHELQNLYFALTGEELKVKNLAEKKIQTKKA